MTDSTVPHNQALWLPDEIWATIASFLDNNNLAKFRQICKITQFMGSHADILQPLYNRLYAIDKSLPALLPLEGAPLAFKQAFEKIQTRQQGEITYLIEHHRTIMAKRKYVQVFQENTTTSLQSLEAMNAVLDKINSEIITAKINPNKIGLDLDGAGITRLPVTLFQEAEYTDFWQNLTHLYCENNNQLTALDVQELKMLQELWCSDNHLATLNVQGLEVLRWLYCNNNEITVLNVQGLTALEKLFCRHNQLTALNLQGLAVLQELNCNNNPLKTLILTGVHANTKNKYAELERSLLFKKLSHTDSVKARQAIIRRLGDDYTYKNCFYYCPVYAATLFTCDSANSTYNIASSTLSQASAFWPSFSFREDNNIPESIEQERKCHENEMHIENSSEDSDIESYTKKKEKKIT